MTRHLLRIVACSVASLTAAAAQAPDTLDLGQSRIWALTSGEENFDHSPFWSPDGDTIAFVRGPFDRGRIWIKASDGSGEARQITFGAERFGDWYPDFSPDGRQVCFSSNREGVSRVWIVSLDGGEPRPLVDLGMAYGGVPPTWSPDGTRIAYTAQVEDNPDIYTVPVEGGTPLRLTSDPLADMYPTWSADGATILYSSGREPDSIWLVPATGGVPRSIPTGTSQVTTPKASPDGRWILYRALVGGDWHVYIISARGGEPVAVTTADTLQGWMADWSPDGSRIAYTRGIRGGWGQLVVIASTGGASRTVADSVHTFAAGPMWSPDGRRITYISAQRDLLAVDVETSRIDTLAKIERHEGLWSPKWSPDGEWIAFASRRLGDINLWLVSADGQEAEAITLGPGTHVAPVFASDGETIYFLFDPGGAWDLWTTTVWGDPPTPVLTDPQWEDLPLSVRPEEGDLVFYRRPISGSADQEGYWSVPLEGGPPRMIHPALFPGQNGGWGWPPDDLSRLIEADLDTGSLWVSDPAGSEPRLIVTDQVRNPTYSPDGTSIAYTRLFVGEIHDIFVADVSRITGTGILP